MKIADVKRKYKNKWVLAEVLKENALNQPAEVKPLFASNDKNKIYEKLGRQPSGKKTYATLYTGKISGHFLLKCSL